jgi:hypothetical protein
MFFIFLSKKVAPYRDCLVQIIFIVLITIWFNGGNSFLFDSARAFASGAYLVQREKLSHPSGKPFELQKAFPREAEVLGVPTVPESAPDTVGLNGNGLFVKKVAGILRD